MVAQTTKDQIKTRSWVKTKKHRNFTAFKKNHKKQKEYKCHDPINPRNYSGKCPFSYNVKKLFDLFDSYCSIQLLISFIYIKFGIIYFSMITTKLETYVNTEQFLAKHFQPNVKSFSVQCQDWMGCLILLCFSIFVLSFVHYFWFIYSSKKTSLRRRNSSWMNTKSYKYSSV